MKRILVASLFVAGLFAATQAFALDLSQARAQGLVGEKLDGYVGAVSATPESSAVVSDVNVRRRAEYEKISKANGQPVSVVGKVAAERIISGLPAGSFYQAPNGSWVKK